MDVIGGEVEMSLVFISGPAREHVVKIKYSIVTRYDVNIENECCCLGSMNFRLCYEMNVMINLRIELSLALSAH